MTTILTIALGFVLVTAVLRAHDWITARRIEAIRLPQAAQRF
jgi:hypothetical protein